MKTCSVAQLVLGHCHACDVCEVEGESGTGGTAEQNLARGILLAQLANNYKQIKGLTDSPWLWIIGRVSSAKHETTQSSPVENDAQPVKREAPYVWVTWLTKLLVGKDCCLWSVWFRANYRDYVKRPSNFDSVSWNIKHTAFLDATESIYKQRFEAVQRENQNSFRYKGRSGAALAGKPDLVGINEREVRICDVKTGQRQDEHWVQMMLYMYFYPRCFPRLFGGLNVIGELVYEDGKQEVYMEEFTDMFRGRVLKVLNIIAAPEPPEKMPSATECGNCHITAADCTARVDEGVESQQSELGDF